MRQLERWLHQHIFKVGWLITKSFQTTTILYYTFFLPGVFLHEVSYWFVAGVLNVHAKSSIQWPEPQEIAELDLSFVELAKNASPIRLAIITLAPIMAGLVSVWLIANNILNFNSFFSMLSTGDLANIAEAVRNLAAAPDFWLWIYLLFAISNTMTPKLVNLRGLRMTLVVITALVVLLFIIGVGNQVVLGTLAQPLADIANVLSGTFAVIICIDLFFVILLGTIESIIERITGDSATFRRGKLVAMTRQEVIDMHRRQSRRETRTLQTRTQSKPVGTLSIYSQALAIPGGPGDEPVTQSETVIVEADEKLALPQRDDRKGPDLITGSARAATPARVTPALPDRTGKTDSNSDSQAVTGESDDASKAPEDTDKLS